MPYKDPEKQRQAQKEWREAHPGYWKDKKGMYYQRRLDYTRNNRDKISARNAVYHAVKSGKLIRPDTCSRCGKEGDIQADHHDYKLKLDVIWLCRKCHQDNTDARRRLIQ